jgi:acyl carrier protein
LEFLGRRDNQVKILGHRIELGEIEAVLLENSRLSQACVTVSRDATGSKRLIAYTVPKAENSLSAEELKKFLSEKLPAYMVPSTYISLNFLPLTLNGKVDRAALPAPESNSGSRPDQLAGNELEQTVRDLWRQVLGVNQVGLDENFFDLGGDSLLIVAVHAQLQKLLHREIQVVDLFEHVTVRSLARHLSASAAVSPAFAAAQEQARKQREALVKRRQAKGMTP